MMIIELFFLSQRSAGATFTFMTPRVASWKPKSLGSGGSMVNSFLTMIRKNDHCFFITKKPKNEHCFFYNKKAWLFC